jgi:threonyl-tRNA synthetase
MDVKIKLPDGSERTAAKGSTYLDVAQSIGAGLARAALAVRANGQVLDMTRTIETDVDLEILTSSTDDGLEVIRHSTAHILAMAVQRLWPGTQVTIGPVIENGFYYDFAFPEDVKISEKDFPAIEAEMKKIVKENLPVFREEVPRYEAMTRFEKLGETYKVELIRDLPDAETITVYGMGDWFDLCRGPHIATTKQAGSFKLTAIAGAYWRGNENNAMLTRIYGTAWANKKDLEDYLERLEEAKKRDHRILGKQLDLFSFHPEAPANAFFHAKGASLYNRLTNYMRQSNRRYGFTEVNTPLIMNVELWHQSGHYDNYRDNMYFTHVDEVEAAVKPMNCPGHCLVYKNKRHSYRDLPVRMAEFGRVHRHERSGVTHGLFRVRTFVQDDAHVFCTLEQVEDELVSVITQIGEAYKELGFENYRLELSTRPEKSIGSDEVWEKAESALESALKKSGKDFKLNPGDGAFYGPKIDFHLIDCLHRSWQCGTLQLDFSMPERFGLEYQTSEDKGATPVMLHRAVLGSIERFLGIFIEHYAGHFPLWASPTQTKIINVNPDQEGYAREVQMTLEKAGVRAEADFRNEKLGYKIREAQLEKVPYMIVIGAKEAESNTVSPRHWQGNQLDAMSVDAFVNHVKSECGALWSI